MQRRAPLSNRIRCRSRTGVDSKSKQLLTASISLSIRGQQRADCPLLRDPERAANRTPEQTKTEPPSLAIGINCRRRPNDPQDRVSPYLMTDAYTGAWSVSTWPRSG